MNFERLIAAPLTPVVGMNIAAVKDGQPFMARGYGYADIANGKEVTNRTLFYIASTSKAVTGLVTAKILMNHARFVICIVISDNVHQGHLLPPHPPCTMIVYMEVPTRNRASLI